MLTFWNDESGAVTIEWTVLVATIGALGLASISVVQMVVSEFAQDASQLGVPIAFQSFDQNAAGWTNPGPGDLGEDGGVGLGPFRADEGTIRTQRTFQLPPGTTRVMLEFELIRPIGEAETFLIFTTADAPRRIALEAYPVEEDPTELRVTLPVDGTEFTLGFGAITGEGRSEWAIDNLTVATLP